MTVSQPMHQTIEPGFADPVHDSQAVFRAVLEALANPGRAVAPPPAMGPIPAVPAIALTLCDLDTPVWATAGMHDRWAPFLAFHCGCPLVDDPRQAAFALVDGWDTLPDLAAFNPGDPTYPDSAATLVIAAEPRRDDIAVSLSGPGVPGGQPRPLTLGPRRFWDQMAVNGALYPMGIDVLVVGPTGWIGLPRTIRATITQAEVG